MAHATCLLVYYATLSSHYTNNPHLMLFNISPARLCINENASRKLLNALAPRTGH